MADPVDTAECRAALRKVERKRDELRRATENAEEKCSEEAQQRYLREQADRARENARVPSPPLVIPEDNEPVFDDEGTEVPSVNRFDDDPVDVNSASSESSGTSVRSSQRPNRPRPSASSSGSSVGSAGSYTLGYNDIIDGLPLAPGSVSSRSRSRSGSVGSVSSSSSSSIPPAAFPRRSSSVSSTGSRVNTSLGSVSDLDGDDRRPRNPEVVPETIIQDDASSASYPSSYPGSSVFFDDAAPYNPVPFPRNPEVVPETIIQDDGSLAPPSIPPAGFPSGSSVSSAIPLERDERRAKRRRTANGFEIPLPDDPDYEIWWRDVCALCDLKKRTLEEQTRRAEEQTRFDAEQRMMQTPINGNSTGSVSTGRASTTYRERVAAAAVASSVPYAPYPPMPPGLRERSSPVPVPVPEMPYAPYPPMAPGYSTCPPCSIQPPRRRLTTEDFNVRFPNSVFDASIASLPYMRQYDYDVSGPRSYTDFNYSYVTPPQRPVAEVSFPVDLPSDFADDGVSSVGSSWASFPRPVSTDRYPVNLGVRRRGDAGSYVSGRPERVVPRYADPISFPPPLRNTTASPPSTSSESSATSVASAPRPVSTDRYPVNLGVRRRGDTESVISGRPERVVPRYADPISFPPPDQPTDSDDTVTMTSDPGMGAEDNDGMDASVGGSSMDSDGPDYPGIFASTRNRPVPTQRFTRASGFGDDLSLPSQMSETSSRVRFPQDGSEVDRVEFIPVGGVPGSSVSYVTDEDVYQGLSNLLVWACKPMKAYRVSNEGFEGGEPKKTPVVDIGVKNIWNPTGTLGVGGLYLLRFDGVSETDPGVAGAGAVIYDVDGEEYWFGFKKLGTAVTESIAEYCSMIYGLKAASSLGVRNLILESDSNLVVKQMNGQWEVKNPTLKKFYVCIQKWIAKFDYMEVRYIKSTTNTRANWLARNANTLS